jgi:hypothetical protein
LLTSSKIKYQHKVCQLLGALLICFLLTSSVSAQTIFLHHPELQFLFEDSLLHQPSYHSVFKPIQISRGQFDSYFGLHRKSLIDSIAKNTKQKQVWISPVLDASGTFNKTDQRLFYQLGQGLYVSGNYQNLGFEVSGEIFEQSFPASADFAVDSLKLVPGYNRVLLGNHQSVVNFALNGIAYWKPIPFVTLSGGNNKQFWGDGYRSLLLSENAASYPFIQAKMQVWKIAYEHQVMFLKDLIPGEGSQRFNKYTSMHLLSCNVSRWLNFYIFEAVVWQQKDSIRHRGFDVQYLNPAIFFRSVEYNMGSPDNMLMGIGGKIKLWDHTHFYGQFLLDEFNLKAIVKNWGWWGNKHGLQAGIKIYGASQKRPKLLQIEYNLVRPYTYSHTFSPENYGYLNEPLAHPYGANFEEFLAIYRTALTNQCMVNLSISTVFYGTDPSGLNDGGDIYKNNYTFISSYGNHIGQGIPTYDFNQAIVLSRMLVPSWRLRAGITITNTFRRTEGKTRYLPSIQLGINTLLYE